MKKALLSPFHLAIPVKDLTVTRAFYRDVLGLQEGRSSEKWVDFNFYGHQLVLHRVKKESADSKPDSAFNPVDGHDVPVPHFGLIVAWNEWPILVSRLSQHKVRFVIEPYIRFQGQVGEQATMFFYDPSSNALEFKSFKDPSQIFAK
ncbi:MAG TPA: VOC family protein [Alphaproteobacteria bacterium]|jgi:hypothetical protein|nr:VOC family protein [Alphaproteobacteria bacterium]